MKNKDEKIERANMASKLNGGLACCPHCGGTAWFDYTVMITGKQWMEWDGTTGANFSEYRSEVKSKYRCVDCRKIIAR